MSAGAETPRRIWLCADDYGISASVDTAIRDLIVRGRLNATSAMVVAPALTRSEAISLIMLNAAAPRVAIGLHLTLTAPFRPRSAGFAPLRDGAFLPLGATLGHAVLRRFDRHVLMDEIRSQLEAFAAIFGRAPDFIDGHQHVHVFPQIGDAALAIVRAEAPKSWLRQCGRTVPWSARFTDGKGLLLDVLSRRFRRRASALGLATNPGFAGTYDFHDAADIATLFPRFLEGLPDGGLIMCHPGFVDAELRALDPLTTLREKEHAFFAGDEFPHMLAAGGVALWAPAPDSHTDQKTASDQGVAEESGGP
jgi:predicted glycoside hydrolase/deacetylase ChbG (UPF0249 family)